ncbi:unnamed protein product [Peronospora effusa]|uniref:Uncharacterized protein n=1 Tax=Peronospora effusa TaxID=542832 RepID=A0A3M6VQV3_9STRA|nr:hypothetical protein DD238_002410 [Peronospora effusa]RQM09661.1 hypothetical protein DD237_007098 [Peronospora effusa]CAI5700922.1 unnamed protein product [Peronospora effusa]
MMDNTKGLNIASNRLEANTHELSSTSLVAGPVHTTSPNRSLAARVHRSRKGFASGKSRLSLKIDADCMTAEKGTPVTRESTPASTSSCGSDAVPWWEVEYQCPPPGHLGAHVVPVSAEVKTADYPAATNSVARTSSNMTSSTETNQTQSVSIGLSTRTQIETMSLVSILRPGLVLFETPDRARRSPHSKLLSIRASSPRRTLLQILLLVDNSPSQKRKIRSQDVTDCETDLFYAPMTKELKRVHKSSQAATPSTLVQPLAQIGLGETRGLLSASKLIEKTEDDERPAP